MGTIIAALFACSGWLHAPWSSAWWDEQAACYLDNAAYRRASMEASLANHGNSYSRHRLAFYGLVSRGWDALPVWNPRSVPVTTAMAAALARGETLTLPAQTAQLWNGKRPTTAEEWERLGERVFFAYPLRVDPYVEHALANPALGAAMGIERDEAGNPLGVVLFTDVDGRTRVGITCALCHTAMHTPPHSTSAKPVQRAVVVGAARRALNYGGIRLAYSANTGAAIDPGLASRMASWGPGRADVTEDNDEDPVAIPDLWGLRYQVALTQAGTITNIGPVALAIRQETQLLHANRQRIRPPRELAWALARFVYAIEPPPLRTPVFATKAAGALHAQEVTRGATIFAKTCQGCHSNPVYGGRLVAAEVIGTDPSLANGAARGTGYYRVPSLLRVCDAAPYFHDGTVASLQELFSPARLRLDYRKGARGPGPIPGHLAGTQLASAERDALIAFLCTL